MRPAEGVLLVHEEAAMKDEPGTRVVGVLGPLHVESGYGISLVCSGPGDATYEVLTDNEVLTDSHGPIVTPCEDASGEGTLDAPRWKGDISISVTADAATQWRLVVFDPPEDE
jgi:hypothetical protein